MAGSSEEENPIWSALKEPLSSFVGVNDAFKERRAAEAMKEAKQAESHRIRYRKRIQSLQMEVEDVNEEATNTRRLLWETEDKLKEQDDKVRQLENHLQDLLELREKDLAAIKSLRASNSDCVENESRAREAMDVFKKCYKRAQLKLKQQEEEIAVLREQRESFARGKVDSKESGSTGMVSESALEYIQTVSSDKEHRLEKMLSDTQVEADLWKSKYKVANKRCLNWQEQILAMEHPSEGAEHIKRQRIAIDKLEEKIVTLETERAELERLDSRNPFESIMEGAFCQNDTRDGGLSQALIDSFQNFNCSMATPTMEYPNLKMGSSCT